MATGLAARPAELKKAEAEAAPVFSFRLPAIKGISDEHLLMFTRQMSALLRAGIPLTRALPLLADQAETPGFRKALAEINFKVVGGAPLSAAMSRHRAYFSPLYTGMVRMGEVHGDLTRVMNSLAEYQQREVGIKRELKQAMVYPAFILGFTMLFTLFIFNFILPYFVSIFDAMHVPLPLISQVLVFIVRTLNDPVGCLLSMAGFGVGLYFLKCYLMSAPGSKQWDSFKLQLPIVGRLLRKIAVARAARSLSLLMSGGINLLVALELAGVVSGNKRYQEVLSQAGDHLRKGQPLHSFFKKQPFLFPVHFSQMVLAGEEAGRLEDLLAKLAEIYEMDVEYALRSFTSALEPMMVLFTGTIIGFIILGVFLPLYGYMQNL